MTQPTTSPAPLHIVSTDGAPPTVPSTRVPHPSPAPAGDRDAADLRGHLRSAGWAADPAICYRMLKWQKANNLDDVTAARTIGLPHIGHEVFARLRENRKPIGVGAHWPALQELVIQAAAQARFDAMVAVRPDTAPVTEPAVAARSTALDLPISVPVVQQDGPALIVLARLVERESTRDANNRTTRTRETGQMIADARAKLGLSTWKLARMLASVGASTSPDTAEVGRWDQRLRLYERLMAKPSSVSSHTSHATTSDASAAVAASLPALVASIVAEIGHNGTKNNKRTEATARRIRAAATAVATSFQLGRSYKRTFAGARSLANLLAQVDANARGQAPDDKLLEVWAWRVDAYLPLILALDVKPQPAPVSASPVTAAPAKSTRLGPRGKITTDDERIDGRPVLLADGRLSVTVVRTVRVETKISFADPLWAAAIAAVNA